MQTTLRRIPTLALLLCWGGLFALGGCGDDDNPAGPGGPGDGAMTAKIDGAAWASDPNNAAAVATAAAPGLYTVTGGKVLSGSNVQFVTFTLYNIEGTGTYPLGCGPMAVGGSGGTGDANTGWITPLSGAAGSVTITALSVTRIAGTFSFTAEVAVGSATGVKSVTEGTFDLPLQGITSLDPLPDEAGSRIAATIGGTSWNGAIIVGTYAPTVADGTFIVTASNTSFTLSISLSGCTGAGDFPLSMTVPARIVGVNGPSDDPQGSNCCWDAIGASGSVTLTSFSATRVAGVLNVTLMPSSGTPATGPISVSGEFDIGIPQFP